VQDQRSKSTCVGSTMITSIKVWIPFLVDTMSTRQWKEWNTIEKSTCSYSCPTWKLASHAMATKVLWSTSWVLVRSLPWAQHKKWTFIASMGCVHTYQGIYAIEGCGNSSRIWSVVEKDGEDNRKAGSKCGLMFP